MHCHIVVSLKDQSNKIKLSPLTNHRNLKNGTITVTYPKKAMKKKARSLK